MTASARKKNSSWGLLLFESKGSNINAFNKACYFLFHASKALVVLDTDCLAAVGICAKETPPGLGCCSSKMNNSQTRTNNPS